MNFKQKSRIWEDSCLNGYLDSLDGADQERADDFELPDDEEWQMRVGDFMEVGR